MFTALGADVTLLDVADRLVPFMDAEISDVLARAFAGMGMRVVLRSGWQPLSGFAETAGCWLGESALGRTHCCSRRAGRATPKTSDLQRACRRMTAG